MKKQFILLLTAVALLVSCSNDNTNFEGETVQVSFCAEIPQAMGTRAAGDLTVNKLVCAVFEKNEEIKKLRKVIDIVDGQDIVFTPRLIKGHTYDIVFWAMKDDCYDVDDLTKISRNDNPAIPHNEAEYDAFTASINVNVINSVTQTVTLTRPLAQLNVAISKDDWDTAADIFGMTPKTTEIKVAKKTFCALCGAAEYTGAGTGKTEYTTYTLTASGEEINVNGTKYKSIASCYIFAEDDGESHIIDIPSVKDVNGETIRSNVTIPPVTLQNNYKTNIVGSILTGTVSYTISINNAFADEEHKKDI